MLSDIIDRPSPNHDERNAAISLIVLHYTGMETAGAAIDRLCDPAAKVSAHYVVDEAGKVFRLVDERARAFHAGISHWRGTDNVNGISVGIEIVNRGHFWGYTDFPAPQIARVIALTQNIAQRHGVLPHNVVGHSDIAPARKDDPGERFPWAALAAAGLAIAPAPKGLMLTTPPSYEGSLIALRQIGYLVDLAAPIAAVLAFQRRFAPHLLGHGLSPETQAAIAYVAARVPPA